MKTFRLSIAVTIACLLAAYLWGGIHALAIAAILGVMELSLSFDNAVVNASVLQGMEEKWRRRFLTWGMLVAVVGMRLLFPIVIVAVVARLGFFEVARLAVSAPDVYARHLEHAHVSISAFGGMFLLLVFLHFLIDQDKEVHWLAPLESRLAAAGKLEAVQVMLAGGALLGAQHFLPGELRLEALVAGLAGILFYLLIDGLSALTGEAEGGAGIKRAGVMGFLYLEALDASFSFDGVIGAFAITRDVVVIAAGLAIGAMFVRSLTIFLVNQGTLRQYRFLEHGAHYGIGALAVLMLASIFRPIPELVTGLTGVGFIVAALGSSILFNRRQPPTVPLEAGSIAA